VGVNPNYEAYLQSEIWMELKAVMTRRRPYECVACGRDRALQLHHMRYPADIWKTEPEHCCWLCDRCHEMLHRAPAKYIAIAVTESLTARVVQAQRDEEDGMLGMAEWIKTSSFLRGLGL
jgi:hypothetical protein